MHRIIDAISATLLVILGTSCSPNHGVTERSATPSPQPSRITRLAQPESPLTLTLGEAVTLQLDVPDTVTIDSVQLFLGGDLKQIHSGPSLNRTQGSIQFDLPSGGEPAGKTGIRLRVFMPGGKVENHSQQITLLSDLAPVSYSYRVINEYAHDPEAYTQGLEYDGEWLYEGTGNYGTSSLRRVRLETGEVTKIRNLDPSLFGEGITLFGERIYQVTYKSQVGFIYNKSTFEEIQKVYYQNREGWGLTNNGSELIMSDGTNILYFLDPDMFTINRQIQVYHNEGPAESLNELEYINGRIWANRYYTDEIVIIDPESGKVEGRINLKGILKPGDRLPTTNVLNGIAWDAERDRIFVTGKLWPKLFEIKVLGL